MLKVILLGVVLISTATCDKCTKHCNNNGPKVCGTDGHNYKSTCDLKNAECVAARHNHHLTVLHQGPCLTLNGTCAKYNATCPRAHDYKCGTTGYTYMNECYLKRAQCQQLAAGSTTPVTLLHDGKCDYNSTLQSRNVDCSQYADLSLAGVAIEGLSVKINDCPSTKNQQVCATNGITFSSECNFCFRAARANRISYDSLVIPIAHDGRCQNLPVIG